MRVLVGTSGFSYPAWKGAFYPEDLPAARMLEFYATRFPTVELNATFYRTPSPEACARWREQVPAGFVFALKATRRITHEGRLGGGAEPLERFIAVTRNLGDRLGPVLFQLPPSLRLDLPLLEAFLERLPAGLRSAFEFRHASWLCEPVLSLLRARGAALCAAETDEMPAALFPTARFGYLRLRRTDYDVPALRAWARRIEAQPWDDAFVFFKHEEKATGPRFAALLGALLGTSRVPAPAGVPARS